MFKESILIEKDVIIITVECEKRKFSIEKKQIYRENPERLIPEDLKTKCTLVSSPSHGISNCDYLNYSNQGQWVYKINKPKETNTRTAKPSAKTTNARSKRKTPNEAKKD